MQGDEVGPGKELVQLHILHAHLLLNARDMGDIIGNDLHADALGNAAQGPADAAEADDAQGLAAQLKALAVGVFLPLALAHRVPGDGQESGAGEHVAHSQLRHGIG